MRSNQADMALLAYHGMSAIGLALTSPVVAVRVNVGDNCHLFAPTKVPERHKARAVENNNTCIESRGIEIVVADKSGDLPRALGAQEKCAALTLATAAPAELAKKAHPEPQRNAQGVTFHNQVG